MTTDSDLPESSWIFSIVCGSEITPSILVFTTSQKFVMQILLEGLVGRLLQGTGDGTGDRGESMGSIRSQVKLWVPDELLRV